MSMCVDLAWPRGHMNTAFRLGVPFTLAAAALWNGALWMVRMTSPVVLSRKVRSGESSIHRTRHSYLVDAEYACPFVPVSRPRAKPYP